MIISALAMALTACMATMATIFFAVMQATTDYSATSAMIFWLAA
tara:strand:+ start:811 stop:942 length:132 start_codon:yes stop_codon:yes gene_type:complete